MLSKLQEYYGNHLALSAENKEHYYWFSDTDGTSFGISKSAVSSEELSLLQGLFSPKPLETPLSEQQAYWKNILEGKYVEFSVENKFRVIHFFAKTPLSDQEGFLEAISGIFPEEVTALFVTDDYGVLIEPVSAEPEEMPFEQVKSVLTGDFYIDLDLFVGMWHEDTNRVPERYALEREMFTAIRPLLPPQEVYRREDLVPYLLLKNLDKSVSPFISDLIGDELFQDRDLIYTIKVFLECNMNITLAAKKLYIHRNSLQYRVDKFIEKTGLDVKQFKQAVAVYHTLISHEISNT